MGRGQPLGVAQRVGDGDLHIRRSQIGHDGAVAEFHHRMHDALPVNDHLDPFRRNIEQPAGLNNLKALVHHGGAVNGDFRPHFPGRMAKRLSRRNLIGDGFIKKRPAGSGQQQPGNFPVPLTPQALQNGAVFAVHRQQRGAAGGDRLHHQAAARHQYLFVGQRHCFAAADHIVGGAQTRYSHQRRNADLKVGQAADGIQPPGPGINIQAGE